MQDEVCFSVESTGALEYRCYYSFFFKDIYLFKNFLFIFWLHWVFVAARRLSLVAVSRGYSSLRCMGFSLWWLLLLWSMGSRCVGFSSCGTWAQQLWLAGSRMQAQQLQCMGLVAPRHVLLPMAESGQTLIFPDQGSNPCPLHLKADS